MAILLQDRAKPSLFMVVEKPRLYDNTTFTPPGGVPG
jgi:hypothetical protein